MTIIKKKVWNENEKYTGVARYRGKIEYMRLRKTKKEGEEEAIFL